MSIAYEIGRQFAVRDNLISASDPFGVDDQIGATFNLQAQWTITG
jgi:hypothetical protein